MFYSLRKGTSKQTSFTSTSTKHEDGNKSETDSADLLDISTSREDLSPSRCSCHSGGSNVAVTSEAREGASGHIWSGNLRYKGGDVSLAFSSTFHRSWFILKKMKMFCDLFQVVQTQTTTTYCRILPTLDLHV